ncbi:MAG: hypothetical protein A4E32_01709 [Methanomassiliicoccales archaeon PtaU1.Bin124]|nr:MAG: hypothetical protein A4E32_01709 [Methanomassiliicoccales archaeon PtaU1.Bin124]
MGGCRTVDRAEKYQVQYQIAKEGIRKSNPDIDEASLDKAANVATEQILAYQNDTEFYRRLIMYLTIIVLVVVVGTMVLLGMGKDSNDGLIAIGSAAVGALVGIFSTSK